MSRYEDEFHCEVCGSAVDGALECVECGHDNWEAVMGSPLGEDEDGSEP